MLCPGARNQIYMAKPIALQTIGIHHLQAGYFARGLEVLDLLYITACL